MRISRENEKFAQDGCSREWHSVSVGGSGGIGVLAISSVMDIFFRILRKSAGS